MKPKLFPLILNFENKKVVIFGGGKVGERKAKLFSKVASVVVISKEFTPDLKKMEKKGMIELIKAEISKNKIEQQIKEAFLVIAATSSAIVNKKIEEIANTHGKLLNKVDDASTQVLIPSIVERGDILVAISTRGESPAMSKYLRKMLEQQVTSRHAKMVRLQSKVRDMLKRKVRGQRRRETILRMILEDNDVWAALDAGDKKAMEVVLKRYLSMEKNF